MNLTPYVADAGDSGMPCWNIAGFKISQVDARKILGTPHYVENDPRATAGGIEDHWSFLTCDHSPVFFRMRVPYEQMDICLTSNKLSSTEKSWIDSLFRQIDIQYYDEPWDENAPPETRR